VGTTMSYDLAAVLLFALTFTGLAVTSRLR